MPQEWARFERLLRPRKEDVQEMQLLRPDYNQ